MNTITINKKLLAACTIIAPKADVPYYLRGALVHIRPQGSRLVVTDGHRMIVADLPLGEDEMAPETEAQYTIPRDVIEKIKKMKVSTVALELADAPMLSNVVGDSTEYFKCVDGKFPDYERVIPLKASGEIGCYNVDYAADFKKFAVQAFGHKNCTGNGFTLHQNGTGPAFVEFDNTSAFGILMPMRGNLGGGFTMPTWYAPPKDSKRKAA